MGACTHTATPPRLAMLLLCMCISSTWSATRTPTAFFTQPGIPIRTSQSYCAHSHPHLLHLRDSISGRSGVMLRGPDVLERTYDTDILAHRHTSATSPLIGQFLGWFSGDFDNWSQVHAQRQQGVQPREGGGHEHIHCQLTRLIIDDEAVVYAKYYFNGKPTLVFRDRLYSFRTVTAPDGTSSVRMRIHRVGDAAKAQLRANGFNAAHVEWREEGLQPPIEGCDVFWTQRGQHFEGHMETESVSVFSPEMQQTIVIRDEVHLFQDQLWVNDRGWDEQGNYLYGNVHEVPYKMERVLLGGELQWTLGDTDTQEQMERQQHL